MTGKQLATQAYTLKRGEQLLTLPLQGLAAGTYLVSLEGAHGIIATRAVVVQ